MKRILSSILLACLLAFSAQGQTNSVAKGVNFIETQTYTVEENAEIIKLYEKLRV